MLARRLLKTICIEKSKCSLTFKDKHRGLKVESCLSVRALTTQTGEKVQLWEMSSVGRFSSTERHCLLKRCQSGLQLPLSPFSSVSRATVSLPEKISALVLLECHEDAYSSKTTRHRVNLGGCLSLCVFLDEIILRYKFFPLHIRI